MAFRFVIHLQSTLFLLKMPQHLGFGQNTISVSLLKFSKTFCYTMPKSAAKPDRILLLEFDVTYF